MQVLGFLFRLFPQVAQKYKFGEVGR